MDVTHLLAGFAAVLTVENLLLVLAGCMLGTLIGVLPGVGPVAGTAILIPLTMDLEPAGAIIMLAAIFYGSQYGGTITSVLINTPGEAASASVGSPERGRCSVAAAGRGMTARRSDSPGASTTAAEGWTVLVTAPAFAERGMEVLAEAGCEVVLLTGSKDEAEVRELLATRPIDAVVSRGLRLDWEAMRSCPTLKMISKYGVGVDNIDIDGATALGIPVTYTPGANAQSVAELAIGLMLAAARKVAWLDAELKEGRWTRVQDGYELSGRTLGVVGFGNIGRRVAPIGAALGMDVVVYDPVLSGPRDDVRVAGSLEEVLRVADVLTLHVPLTAATRNLVGRRELDLLPDGAILINTARGAVVDEDALVEALRSGKLRAAGLDTLPHEPIRPQDAIRTLDNVVLTPHVGGSTGAAAQRVAAAAARNVVSVMRGDPVIRACR